MENSENTPEEQKASKRFENFSNLAGAICDSKFIESKVDKENSDHNFDYINYRYLDALARILSISGDCTAVFIKKCLSAEEQNAILSSQMESTFHNLKSRIDLYKTRNSDNMEEWEKALDQEIVPLQINDGSEGALNHLRRLGKDIKANFKDNEEFVSNKLASELQKWESIQIILNTTLYIAFNSNVSEKKTRNVIKNVMDGINQGISTSDPRTLVKIAFLTNKKVVSLLCKCTVEMKKNPLLVKTTTEVYEDHLQKLTKELRSCFTKFENKDYPAEDVKKIPYESIDIILSAHWITEEPFLKLKRLSIRIFQDATKLYFMSQNKEKWVPLNKYEIVQNLENLHAEIALVTKINEYERILHEELPMGNLKNILPYIGISKLCCPLCHCTLDLLEIKHLGTHNILYAGEKVWKLCEILHSEHKNELTKIIQDHLISQIPNLSTI